MTRPNLNDIKVINVWPELKVVQIEYNNEWLQYFKTVESDIEYNVTSSGFVEHGGATYFKIEGQEDWIGKVGKLWHEALNFDEPDQMNTISSWINIQKQNHYVPVHEHGGFLSGITYINVPKQLADPNIKDGGVDLTFPREKKNLHIRPIEGQGLIFLSQTSHNVYPFKGEGIRKTLNYNLEIAK